MNLMDLEIAGRKTTKETQESKDLLVLQTAPTTRNFIFIDSSLFTNHSVARQSWKSIWEE